MRAYKTVTLDSLSTTDKSMKERRMTKELEVFYREERKMYGRVVVRTDQIEQLIRLHVRDRCVLDRELGLTIEWGAAGDLTSCEVTWDQLMDQNDKREVR